MVMGNLADLQSAATTIRRFLTGKLLESGLAQYVIGLSGGVDSALVATLAVRAVGPQKVLGVIMPNRMSSGESMEHAALLANHLQIETVRIEIDPMLDAYFGDYSGVSRLRIGNKAARERMAILFDLAQVKSALVLGTANRTEMSLGYTTWYGDSAASLHPIAELYTGEVMDMARMLEVPDVIVAKSPSADLWPGQTDEGEIGISYPHIDQILRRLIDDGERSLSVLQADGLDTIEVSRVVSLTNRQAFKRNLPAVAPLGRTAIPATIQLQA